MAKDKRPQDPKERRQKREERLTTEYQQRAGETLQGTNNFFETAEELTGKNDEKLKRRQNKDVQEDELNS